MSDRPCSECIWESTDGCTSWECNPITRAEAHNRIKHGKWECHMSAKFDEGVILVPAFVCSCCGNIGQKWMSYCFNCGAKMDLVQDDQ